MPYKVFISYSTKDLSKVNHLKSMLEHSSIEVFVAEYSLLPGQQLSESILTAIKSCNLFILLWSSSARDSEWVPQEIGIAKSGAKTILPVVIERNLSLPGFISDLKYLNVTQDPGRALDWLKDNVFKQAEEHQRKEGLVWMGIGAAILWLASS